MQEIVIREARDADFPELVDIVKNDGFPHPLPTNLEWLLKRKETGDKFFVVDGQNKKPIGFASLQGKFASGAKLHYLSVREEQHHKGIGTALVKKIEDEAKAIGKGKLYLYTHQKNFEAIRFYSKLNFYVVGVFIDKYVSGENALLLCKDFR